MNIYRLKRQQLFGSGLPEQSLSNVCARVCLSLALTVSTTLRCGDTTLHTTDLYTANTEEKLFGQTRTA